MIFLNIYWIYKSFIIFVGLILVILFEEIYYLLFKKKYNNMLWIFVVKYCILVNMFIYFKFIL